MQHSNSLLASLSLLTPISRGAAQSITTVNQCSGTISLAKTESDQSAELLSIGPGRSISQSLVNTGNSLGVSLSSNYYATTTPKLILGYTVNTANGLTHYSVGTVDGNPFAPLAFDLSTSDGSCEGTNTADGVTYQCSDSTDLIFTACQVDVVDPASEEGSSEMGFK
ncbi:hypothetical protein LTR62_007423 [Meristemomyces frigidus]|uniref:Uncharacterized protein n=1 Tax=Meristemomyces frigidus TaxID=1508187 RepID=A0AAN7YT82_9PEZI|nr:hypothetical protein LTR62_007423 [Meristemomyces frigidus]